MSLDLSIKINKKIETQKFLLDIQYLFQKLLEMNEPIEIIIQEIKNKEWSIFEDKNIGEAGQYFTIRIKGMEDGVNLSVYEIDFHPPYVMDEAGLWSNISIGLKKSPVEIVLGAVAAIIMAEKNNSVIEDHSCFWVDKPVNSPEDFYEYLKNDKKFQLYVAQAKYHYDWREKNF